MKKHVQATIKRALGLALLAAVVWGALASGAALAQDDPQAQKAIQLVAASEQFADFLAQYPNWLGWAEQDDGDWWYVEFWSADYEEWLGEAVVNLQTGEIRESFVPRPLPAEKYAELLPRVQAYALADGEVQALLGDPAQWEVWADYDRWEGVWFVDFTRGLDHYVAVVRVETDENGQQAFVLEELFDANLMDAEEQERANRDTAVALAYEAEGVDAALDGHDDWTTYVEPLEENVYSVEFVAGGQELFHAVVNIAQGTILETSP